MCVGVYVQYSLENREHDSVTNKCTVHVCVGVCVGMCVGVGVCACLSVSAQLNAQLVCLKLDKVAFGS